MRIVHFALALIAVGCAGQPTTPPPVVIARASQAAPVVPLAPGEKVDAKRLTDAKKLGYTVVDQDGKELFCRTDLKTGSRVERETVCLTYKEIEELRLHTQQGLANTLHQTPPPAGH